MDRDSKVIERVVQLALGFFETAGLGAEDKVDAALRIARSAAFNSRPETMNSLWTIVFTRLVQGSLVGRPDLARMLSKEDFAAHSGLTFHKIEKLVELDRLLSFETDHGRLFPAFQAWRGRLLPGVVDINATLAREELSNLTRALYYIWPLYNGATILEALRNGLTNEAIAFARVFRGFMI